MSYELCIEVKDVKDPTLPDVMTGFPFLEDQMIEETYDDQSAEDVYWIIVGLAGRKDTNAAQEQFLNTNARVLSYSIR